MLSEHLVLSALIVPFINFIVLVVVILKLWQMDRDLHGRTHRFDRIERELDAIGHAMDKHPECLAAQEIAKRQKGPG